MGNLLGFLVKAAVWHAKQNMSTIYSQLCNYSIDNETGRVNIPFMKKAPDRKYRVIYEAVRKEIASGRYGDGQRLPNEVDLVKRFLVSRPTVARALRELQAQGVIERRAGSGTIVRNSGRVRTGVFGLLIPNLGNTEIFEPICAEMAREAQAAHHTLLWGDAARGDDAAGARAEELCRRYIERGVSGVFFAPLELVPGAAEANRRIGAALQSAGLPVVLLDRDIEPFPARSRFDLVGIDNVSAGHRLAAHLLGLGCRRIRFVARPGSAETVEARIAGCREAVRQRGLPAGALQVAYGDPADPAFLDGLLASGDAALIGANDMTAALLLQGLAARGVDIPGRVRLAGFDDVKYATLLPVPLTTMRQPCREIGVAAVRAMVERIADPALPGRSILLPAELVVRQSCGSGRRPAPAPRHGPGDKPKR
jgi:GntR family transcriptional regulator of arabinose operon